MPFQTTSAKALVFSSFFLFIQPILSAAILKFNAGGLAVNGYQADPSSFVLGASQYYRNAFIPGLSVGLSHRWGEQGFTYQFPTGDGSFDVDLIFAEVYSDSQSVGKRVFSVAIEDKLQLKGFDVFAEAGANKELTKSFKSVVVDDGALTLSFLPGSSDNPMVSGIVIKTTDGSDFNIEGDIITGEGVSKNVPQPISDDGEPEFDHQAHAVAGGPYIETDFNSDGTASVEIDGSLSHSHYNNPDTGDSGKIVSYDWKVDGKTVSTKQVFSANFNIGETTLELTVKDQTGDTASANTKVQILPSAAGGAYCYYYSGVSVLPAKLDQDPKPDEGHPANIINFENDEFPYSKKDAGASGDAKWAARCISDFVSKITKQYKISIVYKGAGATLFVNGAQKVTGGPSGNEFKKIDATVTVPAGLVPLQILYYKSTGDAHLSLQIDDQVAQPTVLGFKASTVIPTISDVNVASVPPAGGGQMMISGTAFFNDIQVSVGSYQPKFVKVSSNQLIVNSIPSQAQAGLKQAPIVVKNLAGSSNAMLLSYDETATAAVSWEQTFLKNGQGGKFVFKQITSIRIGPDSKYYIGGLGGVVSKFDAGKNLVVTGLCSGPSLGNGRAILGIAFNPKDTKLRVYASSNSLYWGFGGPFQGKADGWANGAVETLVDGCGCLCYEGKVISGLPVSNHDHGINQLTFLGGDLLIAIGGFTNAGFNNPGNKLGGVPENPLSGSIVLAQLSKPNFNGQIKYDQYQDPGKAKKISGDISVYASGLRNSFGLEVDSNNQVWCTDNGGNFGYGDVSTSCTTQVPFTTKQFDELNLIQPGKYYGHPNRNRGECKYGGGEKAKAVVVSSTTGVVEYTSNVFKGQLKGELILSKYAASGTGVTWRVPITNTPELKTAQMTQYSGIAVINGKHGELIMPRVQQGHIAVLKPQYPKPATPMVIAVSPRRSYAGATVFVGGENFAEGLTVTFGAAPAVVTEIVDGNGFYCKVPGGSGKVVVTVTVGGASSSTTVGHDFIYM